MNATGDDFGRQRRRKHSAEFKVKVISACRKRGVSISAVALAHKLNANLWRRWVVAEEQAPATTPRPAVSAAPARSLVENRAFIPIQLASSVKTSQEITVELRRGATVVKVGWPWPRRRTARPGCVSCCVDPD